MNQTVFTHYIKPRRLIAAAMAIVMSAYCALGAVYAVDLRAQTPLPLWSGQVALDVDPADGYEGEYVLIYNQSLNGRNVQSTGVLSNIDTTQTQSRMGTETQTDGKLDYHPEARTLDRSFDFLKFEKSVVTYQPGDRKTFQLDRPMSGVKASVEFYLMYSGTNCYVWAPVTDAYFQLSRGVQEEKNPFDSVEPNGEDDAEGGGISLPNAEDKPSDESNGKDGEVILLPNAEDDKSSDKNEPGKEIELPNAEAYQIPGLVDRRDTDTFSWNQDYGASAKVTPKTDYRDERGYHVTLDMAESAGKEFDGFYNQMTDNFGTPVDADGSGKISLLIIHITSNEGMYSLHS